MYDYGYPIMHGNDYGSGFGMSVVFLVVVVLLIAVIVHSLRISHHGTAPKPTPLEIVHERYAKGEIKQDEFEQLKKDLK
jgi:putative membrane protein